MGRREAFGAYYFSVEIEGIETPSGANGYDANPAAVVADFLRRHSHGQPFADLARNLVDVCGDKHFLRRYYADDVLFSSSPFDFIGMPFTDTASLNAMKAFLADDVGRWSWQQMVYGGCFSAYRGTLGACTAFGLARNDQHMSVMAFNGSPDPNYIWTAEITAACAASLRVDPGLPLQYIGTRLKAPPVQSRLDIGERNTLLYDGISTFRVGDDGSVIIERMCTTYQHNAAGAVDNSYLDVETMYGLMFVARDLANYLLTRYARKKLAVDGTPVLAGSNVVTPAMIKASTVAEYRALEAAGYVQNSAAFSKNIVAEDAGNGLVKILAPVDLVNQLRQIAILLQFRKS
jgi:phage tail sheath gpL-like